MANDLTISFTDTLKVVTCWCGINHAIPADLDNFQGRQHDNGVEQTGIYCPLGHIHVRAGKGKAARLEEQLDRARRREGNLVHELDQTAASLRATKGALTKSKKRNAAGVCPCCKRSFVKLADHVKTKHPNFKPESG